MARARVQFDDLLEALHRLLIILQLEAAKSQEVMGLLEVWVQFPGLGKGCRGLGEIPQVFVAGPQVDVNAGQFVGRGREGQGPAEMLQGLRGPVLVFQGQAQEEVDVKARREGGVELGKGRQGRQGRGIQGRGLGQVENDVGVAGAVQEMGAGDQHVHRREIKGRVGGVHHQDLQPQAGQGRQAELDLVLEVGPGEVGEAVQGHHGDRGP